MISDQIENKDKAHPDFFIVNRSELISFLMGTTSISWPLWLTAGVGLILIVVGAFFDVRILFLGLIVTLTIAPTMAFFIYFTNLIDTHIMLNMLPHVIEPKHDYYLVRIYRKEPRKDENGDPEDKWVETGTMTIFESKVTKRVDKGPYSILHLIDSPVKVLYIPRGMHSMPISCELKRNIMKYNENPKKLQ